MGGLLAYAEFYGTAPCHSGTVAPSEAISFPEDGTKSPCGISRVSEDTFALGVVGSYAVFFAVSVSGAGQLILSLDGRELPHTAVGHGAGTAALFGMSLISVCRCGAALRVQNPQGGAPLTLAPCAGGARPIPDHLVILRLS